MAVFGLVLAAVFVAACVLFVARPFLAARAAGARSAPAVERRERLVEGRDRALAALVVAAIAAIARHGRDRLDASRTISVARARTQAVREAMAARSREQVEVFRARRELAELDARRANAFHELGRAVFYGDEAGK